MWFFQKAPAMPEPAEVLPGRPEPIDIPNTHYVNGARLAPPWPDGTRTAVFGFGCFWGAEKTFWQTPGVISTAVGYAGGTTLNPTKISYEELLKVFWEDHDPTQGMRQGNDVGTSYRSVIIVANDEERRIAEASRAAYGERLKAAGYGEITTEIVDAASNPFYYAEDYHQQYLAKNPRGYCPNHATGVKLLDDFVVTPLQYVD